MPAQPCCCSDRKLPRLIFQRKHPVNVLLVKGGVSATQLPADHFQRQPGLEDDARSFGIHPNV